jgi:hypothetical protein
VDWICQNCLKIELFIANVMSVCCIVILKVQVVVMQGKIVIYVQKFEVCGCNVRMIGVSEICVCFVAESHFIHPPTITVCLIMIKG